MDPRKLVALVVAGVVMLTPISTVTATAGDVAPASHRDRFVVRAVGSEAFEPNALIYSTFRFDPERSFPHWDDRVLLADRDQETGVPHTLTVVLQSQLPTSVDEVFACGPCGKALGAHFSTQPPRQRVGLGDGLNEPDDSMLIFEGETIGATVTASPGTVLYFLCSFHPWMQGRLVVG